MWDDYHIFLIAYRSYYQAVTGWGIPPYQITIWLIDDAMLIFIVYRMIWFKVLLQWFDLETSGLKLSSTITIVL